MKVLYLPVKGTNWLNGKGVAAAESLEVEEAKGKETDGDRGDAIRESIGARFDCIERGMSLK